MTRAVVFALVALVSAQDFLAANPLDPEHVSIADDVVANQPTTLVDDAVVAMVDDAALVSGSSGCGYINCPCYLSMTRGSCLAQMLDDGYTYHCAWIEVDEACEDG